MSLAGAISLHLEVECLSPTDKSVDGPSPVATPLMELEENFEEELAGPGEEFDILESTLHAQLSKNSSQ